MATEARVGKMLPGGLEVSVTTRDGEVFFEYVLPKDEEQDVFLDGWLLTILEKYRLPHPCAQIVWTVTSSTARTHCMGVLKWKLHLSPPPSRGDLRFGHDSSEASIGVPVSTLTSALPMPFK